MAGGNRFHLEEQLRSTMEAKRYVQAKLKLALQALTRRTSSCCLVRCLAAGVHSERAGHGPAQTARLHAPFGKQAMDEAGLPCADLRVDECFEEGAAAELSAPSSFV